MATRINNFITQIGQGVKPNMFSVDIRFPGANLSAGTVSDADRELVNVLCKSAALPASNLGVIEVPFRGRTVKIAGDRTFDTWTATFFNDKDMKIRSFFESWLESMNTPIKFKEGYNYLQSDKEEFARILGRSYITDWFIGDYTKHVLAANPKKKIKIMYSHALDSIRVGDFDSIPTFNLSEYDFFVWIVNKSNDHWSLAYHPTLTETDVIYVDSMHWDPPEDFLECINKYGHRFDEK